MESHHLNLKQPHKIFIGRMLSQEAKAEIMYTYDDMRLDHLNHDSNP